MGNITTICFDLAKNVFQVHAVPPKLLQLAHDG